MIKIHEQDGIIFYADKLTKGFRHIYMYKNNKEIGFISFIRPHNIGGKEYLEWGGIRVNEYYRGRGYSKMLLNFAYNIIVINNKRSGIYLQYKYIFNPEAIMALLKNYNVISLEEGYIIN